MEYAAIISRDRILLELKEDAWHLPRIVNTEAERVVVSLPFGHLILKEAKRLEDLFSPTAYLSVDAVNTEPPKNMKNKLRFFLYIETTHPNFIMERDARRIIDRLYIEKYLTPH